MYLSFTFVFIKIKLTVLHVLILLTKLIIILQVVEMAMEQSCVIYSATNLLLKPRQMTIRKH